MLATALLCIVFKPLQAQNEIVPEVDSLLKQLKIAKADTNKVEILYRLAYSYQTNDLSKALLYANQQLDLSKQLGWVPGQLKAYLLIVKSFNSSNQFQKALDSARTGYEVAQNNHLKYWQNMLLIQIGSAQLYKGEAETAIKNYKDAIEYFLQSNELDENISEISPTPAWFWPAYILGWIYNARNKDSVTSLLYNEILNRYLLAKDSFGIQSAFRLFSHYNYSIKNDYNAVLHYSLEQLRYYNRGDSNYNHAEALQMVGSAYTMMKNYVKGLEYCRESLKIQRNISIASRMAANQTMRDIYNAIGQDRKALDLDIALLKDAPLLSGGYGDRTDIYINTVIDLINLKNYDEALLYLDQGFRYNSSTGNQSSKPRLLGLFAYVYYLTGQYDEALKTSQSTTINFYENKPNYMYIAMIVRDAPDEILRKYGISTSERYKYTIRNLNVALDYYTKNNEPAYLEQCYKEMSTTYERMHDYKRFHDAYKKYIVLRDSSINRINQNAFFNRVAEIEFERKEDLMSYQQRLTSEKLRLETQAKSQQRSYYLSGILALLALSFFIGKNYFNQRKSNKAISAEKKRSDDLLLNILPADVAEELKEKGSANARLFDEVTVLFTDFVNFTTVSDLLSPQQLVDELHYCFKTFDEIISKYNIEKIKTIGDAYLAVAGLPKADPNHAVNVVKAAREIRQFIHDRNASIGSRTFNIRIGIHSGSVVAGIVGVKKFAYDIWGDTVNTAARMEQNSMAGKINISEKTYMLVKEQFAFEYRGEIQAKNKGALKMYFVEKPVESILVIS